MFGFRALKFCNLIFIISIGTLNAEASNLNSIEKIAQRCNVETSFEPLYSNEFSWGYGLTQLMQKFNELYVSPKRLPKKAYWDADQKKLLLPIKQGWGTPVEITETFVQTIARHIERAFELKVIDGVFFPDMGHSHLLIPEAHYKKYYDEYEISKFSKRYESFFRDPEISILYHTAEQLKMVDHKDELLEDSRVQFRHRTRNLVGKNNPQTDLAFLQNPESAVNTAGAPAGYVWFSGGFNLSANQKGCFAYQKDGDVYYFDISLFDLEHNLGADEVFSNF